MSIRRFDIVPLAFPGETEEATASLAALVNRYAGGTQPTWGSLGQPLFHSIEGTTAAEILKRLDDIGIRTEIRPASTPPSMAKPSPPLEPPTLPCPSCAFENPENDTDCAACGVVFAKFEKRSVRRMMADSRLEEEINKARRIEQEWTDRAADYKARNPLPEGATAPFVDDLLIEEVPFLRLETDSGPLLLTSKRMLVRTRKELVSIPFEMISGAEFGGGFTILGGSVKMVLTFKAPLVIKRLRASTMSLQVKKNSRYDRETILHWVYSKNFICARCGARDLSFRLEKSDSRARCMRCAADHEIDLVRAVALPTGEGT